jgi:regulator of cell morphogenesis and NO signaling
MPDQDTTLGELAMISRRVMDLLRGRQLDFCCQGQRRLGEVCVEEKIDLAELLAEIAVAEKEGDRPTDWLNRPVADLIVHLQVRFHEPFRQEMPEIIRLAERVEAANASHAGCPAGLAARLEIMMEAVELHLQDEEELLFPILQGELSNSLPFERWLKEHEEHEEKLLGLRELTDDFRCPSDADDEWRRLYESLDRLEADLMEHMHLENNILMQMPGLL